MMATYIRGTPYSAGRVRGRVMRDLARATAGNALLISQAQLDAAYGEVAAFIVVGGVPFSRPIIRLLALSVSEVIVPPGAAVAVPDGTEVVVDGFSGTVVDAAGGMTAAGMLLCQQPGSRCAPQMAGRSPCVQASPMRRVPHLPCVM